MRTIVTLLSNQNKVHTTSQFSNYLPKHIYPRRGYSNLYVRILNVSTPVPTNTNQVAWIFLSELEGNILIRPELDLCLGQVHLDNNSQNRDGLCYRDFRQSSFHRINQIPLNKLSIRLANHESITINSVENRVTCITLEIMDEIETGEQFEIAGFSQLPAENNPFPFNRANDFTIPLPYEINLENGWEVALKSITFPDSMVQSQYWLQVDEEIFYLDVSAIRIRRQVVGLVMDTLNTKNQMANEIDAKLTRSNTSGDLVLRVLRVEETEYQEDILLGISKHVAMLLNPNKSMPDIRVKLSKGRVFPLTVEANLDKQIVPIYSPIGFVHCDIVAPGVVGSKLQPLLHAIPMGQFLFSQNVSFYEPENVLYRDTINRKFTSINVKIMDTNGDKYPFLAQREQDSVIVTLKFRRRQNLASYML